MAIKTFLNLVSKKVDNSDEDVIDSIVNCYEERDPVKSVKKAAIDVGALTALQTLKLYEEQANANAKV